MEIRIVCVGTELLIGHTLNSNLAFLGGALEAQGYAVARETCIPDDPAVMRGVFARELAESDLLILVGGLGPTRDDLTRQVAGDVLGAGLEFHQEIFDGIADFLTRRGVALRPEAIRIQSMVPAGATPLPNGNGTAPGLWCPVRSKAMVLLPGPPRELRPMFIGQVLPRLPELGGPEVSRLSLSVCGVPESLVEERVDRVLAAFPAVAPAYCARPSFVDVRLTGRRGGEAELEQALASLRREFRQEALDEGCGDIVRAIGDLLVRRGWRLATAESCTGGGLGAALTACPGASDWFSGGIVAYSNACKETLLGVAAGTLRSCGAVSGQTAREMVSGLADRLGAECGVAITGIAGPGGGTPEKPVGLVYIAVAVPGKVTVHRQVYPGDREAVRERAIASALVGLWMAMCSGDPVAAA